MTRRLVAVPLLLATIASGASAQTSAARQITGADYDRAATFLAQNLTGTVVGGAVVPVWLSDGRFWYRSTTLRGTEIVVVDPSARRREACPAPATQSGSVSISA